MIDFTVMICSPLKSTYKYVHMSLCAENVGNWSSSRQNDLEVSPKSIQNCFQLLQKPSCNSHLRHFFEPIW